MEGRELWRMNGTLVSLLLSWDLTSIQKNVKVMKVYGVQRTNLWRGCYCDYVTDKGVEAQWFAWHHITKDWDSISSFLILSSNLFWWPLLKKPCRCKEKSSVQSCQSLVFHVKTETYIWNSLGKVFKWQIPVPSPKLGLDWTWCWGSHFWTSLLLERHNGASQPSGQLLWLYRKILTGFPLRRHLDSFLMAPVGLIFEGKWIFSHFCYCWTPFCPLFHYYCHLDSKLVTL